MIDQEFVGVAAAIGAASGRRAARRLWVQLGARAVVVAVLVAVSGVIGAQSARAASYPWVPPSSVTGDASDMEWLSGSASASGWSLASDAAGSVAGGCAIRAAGYGATSAAKPYIQFEMLAGVPSCTQTADFRSGMESGRFQYRCSAGGAWLDWWSGLRQWNGSTLRLTFDTAPAGCSSWSGFQLKRGPVAGSFNLWQAWGWELHGGGTVSVTILCSDGVTVSSVTSGGLSASASCPSGMVVVGGAMSRDGVEVSSVSRSTDVNLADWYQCMKGSCSAVPVVGGVTCTTLTVGVGWCDQFKGGGSLPGSAECIWSSGDPTMALGVPLRSADCIASRDSSSGGTDTQPDQSEDDDTNIIVTWLQRIKGAVDGVTTAVKRVVEAGTKAIEKAIADGISTVVTKLIELIQAVKDGGGGDGGGGGGDEGTGLEPGGCNDQQLANPANPVEWVRAGMVCAFVPAPGTVDGLVQQAKDAIGVPVKPWTDAMTSVASAWTAAPAGCQGPAITIPIPTMQPYVLRPLDACQEPMKTVAGLSRVVATVLLLIAAAWSALRAIAAGFGYQS